MNWDPMKPYPGHGCDPVDTEADLIRRGSSKWLRENEIAATFAIGLSSGAEAERLLRNGFPEWNDVQINNMLTYLELVGE